MCINGNIVVAGYTLNTDIYHSYSDHAMIICVHAYNLGHKSSGVKDITMEFKCFHTIAHFGSGHYNIRKE